MIRTAIRAAILLAVAVIAMADILYFVPRIRLAGLWLIGRAPHCSFQEATGSFDTLARRHAIDARVKHIRDADGLALYSTRIGDFWIPRRGEYDKMIRGLAREQLSGIYDGPDGGVRAGDTVIDCGANVGSFTRSALNSGAAVVVAIEPSPENLRALKLNFAPEIAAGRVIVEPVGVWDSAGTAKLRFNYTSAVDSLVLSAGSVGSIEVPTKTIDQIVAGHKLSKVDFVKIDVEGAEAQAVLGAQRTLKTSRPRLVLDIEVTSLDAVVEAVRRADASYRSACLCEDMATSVRASVAYFHTAQARQ